MNQFNTFMEAKQYADQKAKYQTGKKMYDQKVVTQDDKFYVVIGNHSRIIYTSKGIRV